MGSQPDYTQCAQGKSADAAQQRVHGELVDEVADKLDQNRECVRQGEDVCTEARHHGSALLLKEVTQVTMHIVTVLSAMHNTTSQALH